MQEQLTIKLSAEFISGNPDQPENLSSELQRNLSKIQELLISYHFKSRGRVQNVSVAENSVSYLKPLMGKFTTKYTVGQFNACADVDYSEGTRMEILIDIDLEKAEATLTGEYIPEREPDEF